MYQLKNNIKAFILPLILTILLLFHTNAIGRPISYSGGTTVMQNNGPVKHSLLIHYTPHYTYSIGYIAEYFRNEDIALNGIQINQLLNRWHYPNAQGNLYFKTAVGQAEKSSQHDVYGMINLVGDYETEYFFSSYDARFYQSNDKIIKQFQQIGRLGITPYIGDYGDLHTWLMLELSHQPTYSGDTLILTPLVRLFKGTKLIEIGYSSDKRLLLNWILRF